MYSLVKSVNMIREPMNLYNRISKRGLFKLLGFDTKIDLIKNCSLFALVRKQNKY